MTMCFVMFTEKILVNITVTTIIIIRYTNYNGDQNSHHFTMVIVLI